MAEYLISPGIQITETDKSAIGQRPLVAGAALIGPTPKGPINVPIKVTSYGDYTRRFGTTFMMEESGSVFEQEFLTSLAAKSYFEQGGESLLVTRVSSVTSSKATGTDIKTLSAEEESGSITNVFKLYTISEGAELNSVSGSTYTPATDEREDGSLVKGTKENLRFEIVNVNPDAGTFGLIIRRGDDTTSDKYILESFSGLSLDPNNPNYIAKVIGDQYCEMHVDDEGMPYIDVLGNYSNKSAYVRVEVLKPTLNYFLADGVTPASDKNGISYVHYLPAEQDGGFYGATGTVLPANTKCYFYDEINANSTNVQGVNPNDYKNAIDLLYNTDEYEINMISVPGLLGCGANGASAMVANVVSLASTRGDCIAVVDLSDANASAKQAAEDASNTNSSYAATYYPWLQMYNSCGRLVWVPASVVIPGVYVYNDHAAAPWFAPAGMVRGGIQGVTQTKKKLTKAHRDTLYSKNVNPIGTFPGSGIVIYGQKTLQKKASALDRVNARRLLIELKKKVKDMASGLLFEHNTAATRNSFRAKLEPYLESVVQRQGLYAYKVVIDELNDADTIDRNEFRCQIYIQPTKVIEFIYIDFTITATGVEFNN